MQCNDIGKIELTPAFTAFDDTPQFGEDKRLYARQKRFVKNMKESFAFQAIETMRSSPDYNNDIFHALAKTPKREKY